MFWPALLLDLLLLLLLLLLCRYSFLRAFQKTQNEKQSVVTGCAPRCIAGREAAAAQQQQQQRRRRWRRRGSSSGQLPFGVSGWLLCSVSVAKRVCALSVCASWLSLVALVARFRPRDKAWSANEPGAKFGPSRSLIWEVPGRFSSSSFNFVPSGGDIFE